MAATFAARGTLSRVARFDQRKNEARADVLVYSTEPLKQGIELSGAIEVTLYRLFRCEGHGFHGEADRRPSRRACLQSGRDDPASEVSQRIRQAFSVDGGGKGLQVDAAADDDEQLLRGRASNSN